MFHEDNAPVTGACFSPNGRYVLAWTLDSSIRLWNYVDGRCLKTYQGHTNKSFSINGTFGTYGPENEQAFIASGSEDGTIWLWDVGSKVVLQTIEGHEGAVFSVDAHPEKALLVSGGADGTIRIWRCDNQSNGTG